ncbi:carbon storage regulator [Paenibacillus turicensis]|uniref:Translational regulator CsrA n=1 Tax=Paenibacillus turicensis TaxID=160487 RepID=A0ABS4FXB5_9BACL|nr:carbon storage regulator CsrA [Paenibacillus turicensis]MBP1907231.1 carbon storage regulator [Paenibacillus turicensis]
MLVLSRRKGESIVIQDNIEITVLGIEGDNVRIGITAPRQVDVFRKEIYLSIQELNRQSVTHGQVDITKLLEEYNQSSESDS